MTAQGLGQQIVIGVVIGVTVMVIMAFLERKNIIPPPVAQQPEEQSIYGSLGETVSGWFK